MYIYICSILQHTATHCNTLQHTATHCSILQARQAIAICDQIDEKKAEADFVIEPQRDICINAYIKTVYVYVYIYVGIYAYMYCM